MEYLNLMFGIMNIFTGSMILLVCIPLATGSVKENKYYGIRFKQSFESEEAWYAINRYGGIQMIIWSVVLIAIGVGMMFVTIQPGTLPFWVAVLAPLIMLVPAFTSYRYAERFSSNSQDIPCRRVYVARPTAALLERARVVGGQDLVDMLDQQTVIMTAELPFEQYLEGWRRRILERCKERFIFELIFEFPCFETTEMEESVLGRSQEPMELFDAWWTIQEADYMEIPTDWKAPKQATSRAEQLRLRMTRNTTDQ